MDFNYETIVCVNRYSYFSYLILLELYYRHHRHFFPRERLHLAVIEISIDCERCCTTHRLGTMAGDESEVTTVLEPSYVMNELFAYMFCYYDSDHPEDLKMPVNKFYTSDAVIVA